jgi:uncharacterized membrane protein
MAKDIQDTVRDLLINAIEGVGKSSGAGRDKKSGGGLSGLRGVAAGVGAAALAPMAIKGVGKLVRDMGIEGVQDALKSPGQAVKGMASDAGDHLGSQLKDKVGEKVEDAGGAGGILKDTLKDALPFGGGGGTTAGGGLGIGRNRRMPVQQSVDIGAPLEVVYNQWTQFEDWPNFMHRVTRVTQEDDCTVSFATKIWGKTKEFTAKIETQRPDERVKWRVSHGITHAGVVTFHELGPNLTRVLLGLDVQPGGPLEKAARGMRHVKRAARGDLHRFKAFVEMQEKETGAWRGVIDDGELVEEHDPAYDEQREYSDPEAFEDDSDDADASSEDAEEDEATDEDEDQQPRARRRRPSSNGQGADEESGTRATSSKRSSSGRSSSRSGSSRGRSNGSSGGSGSSRGRSSGGSGSGRRSRSRGANN